MTEFVFLLLMVGHWTLVPEKYPVDQCHRVGRELISSFSPDLVPEKHYRCIPAPKPPCYTVSGIGPAGKVEPLWDCVTTLKDIPLTQNNKP